jgi:putative transcriptional regulator
MSDGRGQPPNQALDALLAGYAAGTLSAPLHALVAGHLALSPRSRVFVRSLEAANGATLERTSPQPVSGREAKLEAIFQDHEQVRVRSNPSQDEVLPHPLARFLGESLDRIGWRSVLPGVRAYTVEKTPRGEAVLYWISPGRTIPVHTHEGSEYTLVLKGGFRDGGGQYRRGDIAIADQDVEHSPQADGDEDCVCFTVADAPLRLTGPVGRLVQWLLERPWQGRGVHSSRGQERL